MLKYNFNRTTPKVKLELAPVDVLDTREERECPHCQGSGNYTNFLTPDILHTMPCAGCEGRRKVIDGVGFSPDADLWEVWIMGELFWAESLAAATVKYGRTLASLFAEEFEADIEVEF